MLRWPYPGSHQTTNTVQYIHTRTQKARILIEKHNIKLHYIESKLNSADLLTKDFDKIYYDLPLWMRGPPCIREQEYPVFKEIEVKEEIGNPDQNIYVNLAIKNNDVLSRIKEVSTFSKLLNITHILKNAGKLLLAIKLRITQNQIRNCPTLLS